MLLFQAVNPQEAAGVGRCCPLRKRMVPSSTVCASLHLYLLFFF